MFFFENIATIKTLNIGTDSSEQTVLTQIRLLLQGAVSLGSTQFAIPSVSF